MERKWLYGPLQMGVLEAASGNAGANPALYQ